jgi:excinuclease UvrABC nuclease subunit
MPLNRDRERLAEAIRSGAPRGPGVYLFRDRTGKAIYVGKSVSLKQRMLSYFRSNQAGLENRIRRMVFHIQDFDFRKTRSELLALLLEDTLIKRNQPQYNVRQQEYHDCRYLILTDDPYPTCRIVTHQEAAGGHVFGPFRDQFLAARIVSVVNHQFGLRSCTDPEPFRKSLNFDLSLCPGPCRNRVPVKEYAVIAGRVLEFLSGDASWVARKLRLEMESSAANCEYEKAAELRERLKFCKEFAARQRFTQNFKAGPMTIHDQGGFPLTYRFMNGNLTGIESENGNETGCTVPEDLSHIETDARLVLDRAILVYGWLNRNAENCRFEFGQATPATPGLRLGPSVPSSAR